MTVVQRGSKWAVVTPGGWTAALLDSNAAAWSWIDRYRPTDEGDCAGRHEWSFKRRAQGES